MGFPIGIQVYSVRREAAANLYGTLKKIKALGYDGVEFAGLYNHTAEEIRDMCADIGLTPISAHVPYLDMVADPEGVLGTYAKIGCKFVAIPYLNKEYRPGTENWPEVVKNAAMLGKVAKKLGIQLCYHNHDFEFTRMPDGRYALDQLYDEVPADILETELDLCWVNVGGEDPANFLRKYKGRCRIVHYKDFYGEKSENMYELIGIKSTAVERPKNFELRPNGSGVQNFPEILKASKESGVEWVIMEQDEPSMGLTPMECAEKSIKYLKSIGV